MLSELSYSELARARRFILVLVTVILVLLTTESMRVSWKVRTHFLIFL